MKRSRKQAAAEKANFDARLAEYGEQATAAMKRNEPSNKLAWAAGLSAATGAALAMAPAAEAGIRYSGSVNFSVERPNPASFAYPSPPKIQFFERGIFNITNTAGAIVGKAALGAQIANVYGYLGVVAFGSTPAVYRSCNAVCGFTDPNFQALGEALAPAGRFRVHPVPEGVSIGTGGAQFTNPTNHSLTWFNQLPVQGNDDRVIRKWAYGTEAANWHLWEGGIGTLSAGLFAGMKLKIDGQDHFGWVRLAVANEFHPPGTPNMRNDSPYKIAVIDWAYETTPNTAILAGDVGQATIEPTGDYNGDHIVDAADYTVWRDSLGQSVPIGTLADGNKSGMIEEGDYTFWKSKFGTVVPGVGAGSMAAGVPEPTSAAIFSLGMLALGATGLARHRRAKSAPQA
jgi:hypothetical protein